MWLFRVDHTSFYKPLNLYVLLLEGFFLTSLEESNLEFLYNNFMILMYNPKKHSKNTTSSANCIN
jgi:hypothetical protein